MCACMKYTCKINTHSLVGAGRQAEEKVWQNVMDVYVNFIN